MIKRTLVLSLLMALILSLSFTLQPSADELPADSFSKYVSEDAFLFAEFNDVSASLERAKGLSIYKMAHDEEIVDFANEISRLINRMNEEEGDEPIMDKVDEYLKLLGAAVKGRAFMAVPKMNPAEQEVQIVMGASIDEQTKAAAQTLFDTIKQEIIDNDDDQEVLFNTFTYEGYQITSVSEEDSKENEIAYYGMTEKVAFITFGKATLETFLANLKTPPEKSLYKNADFVESYKKVTSKEAFWYGNMAKIMDLMRPMMEMTAPQMGALRPLMEMSTKFAKNICGGFSFEGLEVIDEMFSLVNMDDEALPFKTIKELFNISCSMKSASVMPDSAMGYFAISVPFDKLYEDILNEVPQAAEWIALRENELMLSFKDEIIPAFGQEIGISGSFAYMTPNVLAAIELEKPEIVEKLLTGLAAIPGPLQMELKTFNDHPVYVVNLPAGPTMQQAAISVKDNWLFIGLSQSVQAAITCDPAKSLAANQQFVAAKAHAGQMKLNGMFYLDIKSLLALAYDQAIPMLQGLLTAQPDFDPTTIPSKHAVTSHLIPMTMFFNYEGNSSKVKTVGPIPYSLVQVLNLVFTMGMSAQMAPAAAQPEEEEEPEDVF